MADLSIVIVNYNTSGLTLNSLKSIYSQKWQTKFHTVVVDNGSSDDSVQVIRKNFSQVEIIEAKKNLGFAGGNNLALKNIKTDLVLLLNSDTLVQKGAIDNLVEFMQKAGFDIVSCKLLNEDHSLQPNAGDLPFIFAILNWLSGLDSIFTQFPSFHQNTKKYYKTAREVGWVGGTAMLIRSDVFYKIGYFDEKLFMYVEDVEFCQRAQRAGFKIGWTPNAEVIHLGGKSSNNPKLAQWKGEFIGLLYIYKKYRGIIAMYLLKLFIYLSIMIRVVAYLILGRLNYVKTYAKIAVSI